MRLSAPVNLGVQAAAALSSPSLALDIENLRVYIEARSLGGRQSYEGTVSVI